SGATPWRPRAGSWTHLLRQAGEDRLVRLRRDGEGFLRFLRRRFLGLSRVPEDPGERRQLLRPLGDRLQRSVQGHAGLAELAEVVGLAEGDVVPGEERLPRLLHRLLAVEDGALGPGLGGAQQDG